MPLSYTVFFLLVFFLDFVLKKFLGFYIWGLIVLGLPGSGVPCLKSQHLGGRGSVFVNFRPAWSTEGASGHTEIHSETQSPKIQKTKNQQQKPPIVLG